MPKKKSAATKNAKSAALKKASSTTIQALTPQKKGKSAKIKSPQNARAEKKKVWPVGTIGNVLMAKNPRAELAKLTPKWLNELRAAECADFDRICDKRYRAEQVLRARRVELMKLPDVNGVHIGYRRRNGDISYPLELCIRIHVGTKYANRRDGRIVTLFSESIDGIPVDIMQRRYESIATPVATASSLSASSTSASIPAPTQRFDPLVGGAAIAKAATLENWGTLGLPVFRNGKLVLLTNAHVAGSGQPTFLATDPVFTSQDMVHPPIVGGAVVGELAKAENIVRDQFMDAAVITLKNANAALRINGLPDVSPLRFGDPVKRKEVFILGASSGFDFGFGIIQTTNGSVDVSGFGTMIGQIIATPLNDLPLLRLGDSGSVLLSFSESVPDGFDVVGLVHAKGNDGSLVATPMFRIAERFGLSLF